jgi:hypothetical protein
MLRQQKLLDWKRYLPCEPIASFPNPTEVLSHKIHFCLSPLGVISEIFLFSVLRAHQRIRTVEASEAATR